MDSLLTLLPLIIIGLVVIIKKFGEQSKVNDNPAERSVIETIFGEREHGSPPNWTHEERSDEMEYNGIQPVEEPYVAYKPQPMTVKRIKPVEDDPHRNAHNGVKEEVEHMMDDFDLRKAVIYSEILKPKFDE